MVDINEDLNLLQEYTQWVATQQTGRPDTSPDEFMRDRVKQVAVDRLDNALSYLRSCDMLRTEPNKHKVRALLEGRDADAETSGGTVGESVQLIPASQPGEDPR